MPPLSRTLDPVDLVPAGRDGNFADLRDGNLGAEPHTSKAARETIEILYYTVCTELLN
jgi:hypothetical protein